MNFFNTKQFWVPAIVLIVLIIIVVLLGRFVALPNQDDSNAEQVHTACQEGDYYDLETGKACPNPPVHTACQPGDLFNIETGVRC